MFLCHSLVPSDKMNSWLSLRMRVVIELIEQIEQELTPDSSDQPASSPVSPLPLCWLSMSVYLYLYRPHLSISDAGALYYLSLGELHHIISIITNHLWYWRGGLRSRPDRCGQRERSWLKISTKLSLTQKSSSKAYLINNVCDYLNAWH